MSKKETEFDRFDRMKKMERESSLQKRKQDAFNNEDYSDASVRLKSGASNKKSRPKNFFKELEEEFV